MSSLSVLQGLEGYVLPSHLLGYSHGQRQVRSGSTPVSDNDDKRAPYLPG